ncbi:MAG: hypothetical protein ACOX6U_07295 [Oscillospiraceae bacterium]|jgi:hypothetical protein
MNIPMPGPEERKTAIEQIVKQGLPARRRNDFFAIFCSLNPKVLFFGVGDCLFVSFLFAVFAGAAILASAAFNRTYSGMFLFLFSPALYFLLHCLTTVRELQENTREIPMTCRYTQRHLTAMRMLYFGGFGVAVNTVVVLLAAQSVKESFLQMLGLSLSSLFLYASWTVFCLLRFRRTMLQLIVPPAVWFVLVSGLSLLPDYGAELIGMLPSGILLLFAGCFCAIFLAELHGYYGKNKEETTYAVG